MGSNLFIADLSAMSRSRCPVCLEMAWPLSGYRQNVRVICYLLLSYNFYGDFRIGKVVTGANGVLENASNCCHKKKILSAKKKGSILKDRWGIFHL